MPTVLLCGGIFVYFFVMNSLAHSGLDDSAVLFRHFWNDPTGAFAAGKFLTNFLSLFRPPSLEAAADPDSMLFRPLRYVYYFCMVHLFDISPVLAAAVNACGGAFAAFVVHRLARTALPPLPAIFATALFFACTPVIAMGQVYMVSQFVMISFIGGVTVLAFRYVSDGEPRHLLAAIPVVFFGGWYGEAILMPIAGVFVVAGVQLLTGWSRAAARALALATLLAVVLVTSTVLVRVPLSSFGLETIRVALMSIVSYRGYAFSDGSADAGLLAIVSKLLAGIRFRMFGSLFFASGPLLFVAGTGAALVLGLMRRRFLGPLAFLAIALLLFDRWDVNAVIGGAIACLCLFHVWRQGTGHVAAFCLAFLAILGPVFSHDTHTAYVLPFLTILLVASVVDFWAWAAPVLAPLLRPALKWAAAGTAVALAGMNLWTGAYFAYAYTEFNRGLYERWSSRLSSAAVIGNFRQLPDLYVQGRYPEPGSRPDIAFSVEPSLVGREFPVPGLGRFEAWLAERREAGIPAYAILTDHHRLPGYERLFYDAYADRRSCRSARRDAVAMKASAPFLDPGYLLAGYFQRLNLTPGFAGWPIFPDTLNDLGLEYGAFRKTLFAVYELRELLCPGDDARDATMPPRAVRADYRGYRVIAEADGYSAALPDAPERLRADSYHNIARRIDATFGDTVSAYSLSDQVGTLRDHGRFRIVVHRGIFYATLLDEAPFDKALFDRGLYGCAVRGTSPDAVVEQLATIAPACEEGTELRPLAVGADGRCLLYGRQRTFIVDTCRDLTDIRRLQVEPRDAIGFNSRRLAESVFDTHSKAPGGK